MKGKLTFYCRMTHVSRQAFYKYLQRNDTDGRSCHERIHKKRRDR